MLFTHPSLSQQASTQWRKVQDRLEADERCSRLEKIDRLEIFQVIIFIQLLPNLNCLSIYFDIFNNDFFFLSI